MSNSIFYNYFEIFLGPHYIIILTNELLMPIPGFPKVQTYSRTFSCINGNNW